MRETTQRLRKRKVGYRTARKIETNYRMAKEGRSSIQVKKEAVAYKTARKTTEQPRRKR